MKRWNFPPVVRQIAHVAFCDNGADISLDDIAAALDLDRGAGFSDPSPDEVPLLIRGGESGTPPPELCEKHPALDALLTMEMT